MCNVQNILTCSRLRRIKTNTKLHRNPSTINGVIVLENAYFHLFWKSIQAKWNAAPDRALSLWRHYAYPKLRSVWPTMKITPTTKRYSVDMRNISFHFYDGNEVNNRIVFIPTQLKQNQIYSRNFQFETTNGHNDYKRLWNTDRLDYIYFSF